MNQRKCWQSDWGWLGLLVLLVLVYFHKLWLSGQALNGGDLVNQFYPWKEYLVNYFKTNGSVPLWNPYTFSGNPFAANYQVGLWYPLDLIFFIVNPAIAFQLSTILHFILAGSFMYLLARHWGVSRPAGFLAGFLFTFGGFLVCRMQAGNYTLVTTYPWIPLIFYFFDRYIQERKGYWLTGFVLALSCQVLGGHPQPAYYSFLVLGLYATYRIIMDWQINKGLGARLFPLFGYLMGVVLIVCVTAIQILPTMELAPFSSSRSGGAAYEFGIASSLGFKHLLLFFSPFMFGEIENNTYWLDYEGYIEMCGFTGILTLLLVAVGIMRNRTRKNGFWIILLTFCFLLAMGKYNPIYPFLYHFIPGLNLFRCPARWLMYIQSALAMLAAFGFDSLFDTPREDLKKTLSRLLIPAGVIFLFMAGFLAYLYWDVANVLNWLQHYQALQFASIYNIPLQEALGQVPFSGMEYRYNELLHYYLIGLAVFAGSLLLLGVLWYRSVSDKYRYLIIGFVVLEVLSWSGYMMSSEPMDQFKHRFQKSQEIQFLTNDTSLYRVLNPDSILSWKYTTEEFEGRPNRLMIHGIQDTRGYDPTILKQYTDFINVLQGFKPDFHQGGLGIIPNVGRLNPNYLSLMNVKYICSMQYEQPSVPSRLAWDGRMKIYELMIPHDRVFFVPSAVVISDRLKRLSFMSSPIYQPRNTILLESKPDNIPDSAYQSPISSNSTGYDISIQEFKPNRIKYHARITQPGFIVFSEIFYPGWKLTENGKEIPIYRANHTFRAAYLTPGDWNLVMEFKPKSFKWGMLLSIIGFIAIISIGIVSCFRTRKNKC